MRLKDYYRTLEVATSATSEEIRKSYRKLANKYHPDKNSESKFATAQFIELKEAYEVLGDKTKRYKYDEERWLLGMTSRSQAKGELNAVWLAAEGRKLKKHLEQIDAYRMNHGALQQYVMFLLSDAHIGVMESEPILIVELASDVVSAVAKLKMPLMPPVMERLFLLAKSDPELQAYLQQAWQERQKADSRERYFPLLLISIVVLVLVLALLAIAG